MTIALWAIVGALIVLRLAYPRVLEQRHAHRFRFGADGIIVGAQTIDLTRPGAPAVLALHGGGDTPQSMRGLAEYLHQRGYAVRAPLLARHGRSLANVRRFDASQWFAQALDEFDALRSQHPSVAIVGQSVGGALALDVASRRDVRALVLLAPWVAMPATLKRIAATSVAWGALLPYLPSLGGHSIHDPIARAQALTHGFVTSRELRALMEVAAATSRALPRVTAPTLTIQSRGDERIAAADADAAFQRLAAKDKRFEWTTGAGHVISVDYGCENVFKLTAAWLDAHRGA